MLLETFSPCFAGEIEISGLIFGLEFWNLNLIHFTISDRKLLIVDFIGCSTLSDRSTPVVWRAPTKSEGSPVHLFSNNTLVPTMAATLSASSLSMKSVHMRGAQPLRMATPMRAFSRSRVVAVSAKEYKIAIIPGDGIGPEIMAVGKAVMEEAGKMHGLTFKYTDAPIGGQAIDLTGHPMPEESLKICQAADSCLMSAIGG
jgi:hypothetical protein